MYSHLRFSADLPPRRFSRDGYQSPFVSYFEFASRRRRRRRRRAAYRREPPPPPPISPCQPLPLIFRFRDIVFFFFFFFLQPHI